MLWKYFVSDQGSEKYKYNYKDERYLVHVADSQEIEDKNPKPSEEGKHDIYKLIYIRQDFIVNYTIGPTWPSQIICSSSKMISSSGHFGALK